MVRWVFFIALLALPQLSLAAGPGAGASPTPDTEAEKEERERDELRRSCYGGRKKALDESILQTLRGEAALSALKQDHVRVVRICAQALRGGADEKEWLNPMLASLEKVPRSKKQLQSCSRLHRRLSRDQEKSRSR